jgi:hypothetical protein
VFEEIPAAPPAAAANLSQPPPAALSPAALLERCQALLKNTPGTFFSGDNHDFLMQVFAGHPDFKDFSSAYTDPELDINGNFTFCMSFKASDLLIPEVLIGGSFLGPPLENFLTLLLVMFLIYIKILTRHITPIIFRIIY